MSEFLKQILIGQYDAALCMLRQCLQACAPQHWEGRIANGPFRQVAYHTLFYADYYLSPGEDAFTLRELNERGGDERGPGASPGLSPAETLEYLAICRQKMHETLAAETRESLEAPCGFSRRNMSRAELHIYNIRHVQHHTAQFSAYLRRVDASIGADMAALPWIGTGWRG